jgi:GNAT superfamily N-acetyltransferase
MASSGNGSPSASRTSRSGISTTSPVGAEQRGSGIGTALIEHGLGFARRDGVTAFLETGRPGNVAYYERRGFRTFLDGDAPDGGPHIWFMRADP